MPKLLKSTTDQAGPYQAVLPTTRMLDVPKIIRSTELLVQSTVRHLSFIKCELQLVELIE